MSFSSILPQDRSATTVGFVLLGGVYLLYTLIGKAVTGYRRSIIIKENGCKSIPSFKQKDPVFGLDVFLDTIKYIKAGQFLARLQQRYAETNEGVNTYTRIMLGEKNVVTIEPENIKTILATKFKDFVVPPQRNDALKPIFGHGIFTKDGEEWAASRALLRPSFARSHIGNLAIFESHILNLVSWVPKDGASVDLQDLFFKLTLDTATEFLFGESTDVLREGASAERGEKFNATFNYVVERAYKHALLGRVTRILPDKKHTEGVNFVHEYVSSYVRKAVALSQQQKKSGNDMPQLDRSYFLNDLSNTGCSSQKIQDELLNILFAGRDTTASLLSHLFYVLARHPSILNKLRAEIASLRGKIPTFEEIKNLKYLQYCLNEALRLYPVVPINARFAVRDTVLPLGGGQDGKSPMFIAKGTLVAYQVWIMHRRKDIYGEDAEEFRPERWETFRPSWTFLPFNGGPRICIGQQFALTEASYTTIRLLQIFKDIEPTEHSEYRELLAGTLTVKNGVHVKLTPA